MIMNPIIRFQDVSKHYLLGSQRSYARYLLPWRAKGPADPSESTPDSPEDDVHQIWALRNVSFEVMPGETVGLIGPNGAGKTTVLSLLAGITAPTKGQIEARGRIGALIRLGAGFHPDLTGRENIYLNGSIVGLTRRQIDTVIDEVISFAELERFIDTPIKRYSSGMYVRLGFSVAVHTVPDILLIDEVLAVGDASFKSKCFSKLRDIRDRGTTVILVSHQMSQIKNLCDRALLLNGQVLMEGDVDQVVKAYYQQLVHSDETGGEKPGHDSRSSGNPKLQGPIRIVGVSFFKGEVPCNDGFATGDTMRIRIDYHAEKAAPEPAFGIGIHSIDGTTLIGTNTKIDEVFIEKIEGRGSVEFVLPNLALLPGTYLVSVGLHDRFMGFYDRRPTAYRFKVVEGPVSAGYFSPPHFWQLKPPDTQGEPDRDNSLAMQPQTDNASHETHLH